MVVAKYLDGLPLYRQSVLLGRFGCTDLSHSTLSATVVRVGQSVQPVINLMRDLLLESPVVYGDETIDRNDRSRWAGIPTLQPESPPLHAGLQLAGTVPPGLAQ